MLSDIFEDLGPIGVEVVVVSLAMVIVILLANGGKRCEGALKQFERVYLAALTLLFTIVAIYVSLIGGNALAFWMYAVIGFLLTLFLPYAKK